MRLALSTANEGTGACCSSDTVKAASLCALTRSSSLCTAFIAKLRNALELLSACPSAASSTLAMSLCRLAPDHEAIAVSADQNARSSLRPLRPLDVATARNSGAAHSSSPSSGDAGGPSSFSSAKSTRIMLSVTTISEGRDSVGIHWLRAVTGGMAIQHRRKSPVLGSERPAFYCLEVYSFIRSWSDW